ncbi:30S ribosomal protein S16 [Patescibacteria group bacterium]|nr:30S ribosomal protein S16 [Patescibacteria group bacterium]
MLKIKLRPNGKIHQRSFRIVVAPDRSKLNGNFIDDLGFYNPKSKIFEIDKEKVAQWLKNGAQLTEGVDKLLNPDKYPKKIKKKKEEKVAKEEVKVEKTEEVKTEEAKVEEVAKEEAPEETKVEEEVKVEENKE